MHRLSVKENADFIRQNRSPATFAADGRDLKLACTISSPYEDASYPYWFRYDVRWRSFITSAKEGYLILGCTDLDIAFVIPASEMEKIIPQLNTTDQFRNRESYWHIFIREPNPGQFGIVLPKTGNLFDLTPFVLKLS